MRTNKFYSFITFIAFLLIFNGVKAQTSRNYSVLTWAFTSTNPTSITLHFEDDKLATSYQIYRKDLGATGWGKAITTINGGGTGDISYVDSDIAEGQSYEYFVFKIGAGNFRGYGYLSAGVNVAADHSRGTVLLLIDQDAADSLGSDLDILRNDLSGDGYRVVDLVVDKTVKHEAVKDKINAQRAIYKDLSAIYIFGHVAVPYSGIYCNDAFWQYPPDGHVAGKGDHCGAWAADVYYGSLGGIWSDNDTVDFGAAYSWNKNAVGDGKFDQIQLTDKVISQLGRVDLYNMPSFKKSEYDLLRQYIQKSHDYKHAITKPFKRALVDENFGNTEEAFGSNGYRNFSAMVGKENISTDDFISKLKDSTFIWAYGAGGGSFTSAGGIGKTDSFSKFQGAATFNFIFGSFFGDWDNKNAFLRAPLAVEHGGLTNAWAGRPWWHTHPMAFNQTIGYCAQLVQNNQNEYQARSFANNIHIALMGDPTLRMHMFEPVSNLTSSVSADKTQVTLSWTASTASNVDGYNVYVSSSQYGTYTLFNSEPIKGTSHLVNAMGNGTLYFMVRAQRLEQTLSGTFHNLSQGVHIKVDNLVMSSLGNLPIVSKTAIYPNPSNGLINIDYTLLDGGEVTLSVIDIQGKTVYEQVLYGFGSQSHQIDLSHLNTGVYIAKLNGSSSRVVIK